jgi:hypothetical protein
MGSGDPIGLLPRERCATNQAWSFVLSGRSWRGPSPPP